MKEKWEFALEIMIRKGVEPDPKNNYDGIEIYYCPFCGEKIEIEDNSIEYPDLYREHYCKEFEKYINLRESEEELAKYYNKALTELEEKRKSLFSKIKLKKVDGYICEINKIAKIK